MKIAPSLLVLFLTLVVSLHAQIITGHSTSILRESTPRLSLWLNWNAWGGLDGAVTCIHPLTGHVLETTTGMGVVRSRLVSVRFPGHGNFRGRMSEDGNVITGRLFFRENPPSRMLVRRFTLRYSPPTNTSSVGSSSVSSSSSSASLTMVLVTGSAELSKLPPLTNIVAQPVSP